MTARRFSPCGQSQELKFNVFRPQRLLGCPRNPILAKSEIETFLKEYLGVELILWLGQGIIGDVDTDGHVDNLLAFVRPGEVSAAPGFQ